MAVKRFPGLIDVHCHFREPGATHKEDFRTGTRAALKGGFTFVIDMPNNPEPTVSMEALNKKISLAEKKLYAMWAFTTAPMVLTPTHLNLPGTIQMFSG